MGGELKAECPSGLPGGTGTKVTFAVNTYSNDRIMKETDIESVKKFEDIRTLIISGSQHRDEEILGMVHKLGLSVSVTTFTRTTVNQVKANISYADDRYKLIIILGDNELNGFDVAQQLWENELTDKFLIFLINSSAERGDLHRSVSMGIDQCLAKPVGYETLASAIRSGFPFLEVPVEPADISSVRKDLNILVVEDNKMNQKVLQNMLTSLGFSCDIAEDGYEGVLKARERQYDLIFMDLVLPEIDGYEAARKIVAEDKKAVIVAFTADNMPESRKKAELSGIVDYMAKPVRIEALVNLLSSHFKS
jgi:CheY-like chemotaxis protein